jgi:GNAT superfamily N-acetyltransferase
MVEFDDNRERLDLDRVHRWLASSYWSPGLERPLLEQAVAGSHPLGVYLTQQGQVGFGRMITDYATFAWIADVWVDEAFRGQGLGQGIVRWFIEHPRVAGVRRIALNTRDAHGVYAKLGFTALSRPHYLMEKMSAAALSQQEQAS